MANPEVAQLIADNLGSGLPHPGKQDTGEKPRRIPLPAFRTAGMDPHMREHAENTAKVIGEAVVHLIESPAPHGADSVIIKRDQLAQLKASDANPTDQLPMLCRTCRNPVLWVPVANGRALVNPRILTQINPTCPHTMEATP